MATAVWDPTVTTRRSIAPKGAECARCAHAGVVCTAPPFRAWSPRHVFAAPCDGCMAVGGERMCSSAGVWSVVGDAEEEKENEQEQEQANSQSKASENGSKPAAAAKATEASSSSSSSSAPKAKKTITFLAKVDMDRLGDTLNRSSRDVKAGKVKFEDVLDRAIAACRLVAGGEEEYYDRDHWY